MRDFFDVTERREWFDDVLSLSLSSSWIYLCDAMTSDPCSLEIDFEWVAVDD